MNHREGIARAQEIAAQMVSGELELLSGAKRIWREVVDALPDPIPDELWVFKSNASAIEDFAFNVDDGGAAYPEQVARLEEELRLAAAALCARPAETER